MITYNQDSIQIDGMNLDGEISPSVLQAYKASLMEVQEQIQRVANYCEAKANAMECRVKGNIQVAQVYERTCERVYATLPEWAKW